MQIVLIVLNLILFIVFFYKKTREGLHMLQLENYYNDRYMAWMRKHIKKVLNTKSVILLLLPIILLLFNNAKIVLILNIIVYSILILVSTPVKEKKPFVVTNRIRRMYFTYFIAFILISITAIFEDYKLMISITNLSSMAVYIFVYIVNIINRPMERAIRKKYCVRAQNKLKQMPELKIIGITGSYGKTSTKYILNTILSRKYNTLMTPESYNTTMGVIRTINDKLTSTHQFFICEMGAKYVGDIKEICDIINPDYAVITAIGPQHLDTFKTLENVKKTKLELVESLPEEGIAFVNWEDENIRKSNLPKNTIKFGLSDEADYYAENISVTEHGSSFDIVIPNKGKIDIKTRLLGELNILNIVGAIAIADSLGLTADDIKSGIRYVRPVPHRLQIRPNSKGSIIIDDAYNSNIKGANMALDILKTFETKQRVLITPGIVELGDKSDEINRGLGRKATECADYIILVGEEQTVPILQGMQDRHYPKEQTYIAKTIDEAIHQMNSITANNSVILIENDLPDNFL